MSPRLRRVTTERPRWPFAVALTALAVLVIALVIIALQPADRREPWVSESARPTPTTEVTEGTQDSTSAPSATSGTQADLARGGPNERLLVGTSTGLWRAIVGTCNSTSDPLLQFSSNGGATWTDVTPRSDGVGQILALRSTTGLGAHIVGLIDPQCGLQGLRTTTRGSVWDSDAEALATTAYVDPADPEVVISPEGAIRAPCSSPRGLQQSEDGTLAMICDELSYVRPPLGDWSRIDILGSVAIALSPGEILVARHSADCSGLAITAVDLDDHESQTERACVAAADPALHTAIAEAPQGILVWSGQAFTVID